MGRRPNQVILRYFERGAKLPNNRYRQVCRKCGQEYPKGRIETLTAHLIKKCPVLSIAERTAILLELHDLGTPQSSDRGATPPRQSLLSDPITSPLTPTRSGYNGLNVLAEASRRVGTPFNNRSDHQLFSEEAVNPADGFARTFLDLPAVLHESTGKSPNMWLTEGTSTDTPDLVPLNALHAIYDHSHNDHIVQYEIGIDQATPDLSSMAATASDLVAPSSDLDIRQSRVSSAAPDRSMSQAPETPPRALRSIEPYAASPQPAKFVSECGVSKARTPKKRSRFAPQRRREVSDLRKQGACLRCSVLRKSCSDGDPCDECAGVTSPRVWKFGCIRTKLVNEFDLLSVGLQSAIAYRRSSLIRQSIGPEPFKVVLELRLAGITLLGLDGIASRPQGLSPGNESSSQVCLQNTDAVNTNTDRIEALLTDGVVSAINLEESAVIQKMSTLAHALGLDAKDSVLSTVLALWAAIRFLVESSASWHISFRTEAGHFSNDEAIAIDPNFDCHAVIVSQVRSAIERHAANLARRSSIEVQRRLVASQKQNEQLRTVLAVLLLLNSIERTCWLFERWKGQPAARWPFNESPTKYGQQGESFANVMEALLEMRALLPIAALDSTSGILLPLDSVSTEARNAFSDIPFTLEYLTTQRDRPFDPEDYLSVDGRYFARLFQLDLGGHSSTPP